jgi:hypothetical protein
VSELSFTNKVNRVIVLNIPLVVLLIIDKEVLVLSQIT